MQFIIFVFISHLPAELFFFFLIFLLRDSSGLLLEEGWMRIELVQMFIFVYGHSVTVYYLLLLLFHVLSILFATAVLSFIQKYFNHNPFEILY